MVGVLLDFKNPNHNQEKHPIWLRTREDVPLCEFFTGLKFLF